MKKALIRVVCLSLCLVLYLSGAAFAEDAAGGISRNAVLREAMEDYVAKHKKREEQE